MFGFKWSLFGFVLWFGLGACKKVETPTPSEAKLRFRFKFDSMQMRLDNLGRPSLMPAGHAAQSPKMNLMSAHYIELTPNANTPLGSGVVLYHAPETELGGARAIDFGQAILKADGEIFFEYPLSQIPAGDYAYLRVSLGYQAFEVKLRYDSVFQLDNGASFRVQEDFDCHLASFVGYNNYVVSHELAGAVFEPRGNRLQGYWAAVASGSVFGQMFSHRSSGQAPAGATTVVNPLAATSPIPAGSCVVTGAFASPLRIGPTGADRTIEVRLSTKQSFEWRDDNANGLWEPQLGEAVVDMGIRGMILREE